MRNKNPVDKITLCDDKSCLEGSTDKFLQGMHVLLEQTILARLILGFYERTGLQIVSPFVDKLAPFM